MSCCCSREEAKQSMQVTQHTACLLRQPSFLLSSLHHCASSAMVLLVASSSCMANSFHLVRIGLCMASFKLVAVLCCAVLCCAVLCCAVLCCAVLCCAVLCCAVLCCAALSLCVSSPSCLTYGTCTFSSHVYPLLSARIISIWLCTGHLGKNSLDLINYFEAITGLEPIRDELNPATWMLEMTTPGNEERLGVDFASVFDQSSLCRCAQQCRR